MPAVAEGRFEPLITRHLNALYQTAIRLMDNPVDAEKLVRDAYASAFESFDHSSEDARWRLELFKVLIHRIRKQRQKPGDLYRTRDNQTDPIISAIHKMPIVLREVVLLVDCHEFSYSEAAEILCVPKETVAERVSAARAHLRASV